MTAPAFYNEGKKLIEGEVLSFDYLKIIILSDGNEYMVLEDPYGIRHMVPYIHYQNYGIEPGTKVNCRVDRINCTGRVYLEPEHPFFVIGEIIEFQVRSVSNLRKGLCDAIVIKVSDVPGNEICCEVINAENCSIQAGEIIEFRIVKIKKGKPILTIVQKKNKFLA